MTDEEQATNKKRKGKKSGMKPGQVLTLAPTHPFALGAQMHAALACMLQARGSCTATTDNDKTSKRCPPPSRPNPQPLTLHPYIPNP